ncbi:hypothetical protein D3C84_824370 [compost metagenome]
MNGIQVRADRHLGLLPVPAGVIGVKNVTTLTHGDQALPSTGHVQQRTAHGQGTRPGRQIQHVNVAGCLGDALPQRQQHAQGQQRAT